MKKTLLITWRATWTTTVEVDVPGEPLTKSDLNALIDKAVQAADPGEPGNEPEHQGTAWVGEAPAVVVPPKPQGPLGHVPPIPGDAWFEALGARWATNGYALLREDAPLPTSSVHEHVALWRPASEVAVGARALLEDIQGGRAPDTRRTTPARFHPAFAALLGYGHEVRWHDAMESASVWRDGALCAVVAAHRGTPDTCVNAYGQPFPPKGGA